MTSTIETTELAQLRTQNTAFRKEVATLLGFMSQLDPSGLAERHPDWPLRMEGENPELHELCECLNRLEKMVEGKP